MASAVAQSVDNAAQQLLRQQDRERALREQQETTPDVRLSQPVQAASGRLPANETPCFPIHSIRLDGDAASTFRWPLQPRTSSTHTERRRS
jgi:hemolysin activation/secretion protein